MPDKIAESRHVEAFLNQVGIGPYRHVVHGDVPDFIVSLDDKKIGIEHTMFYWPPEPGDMAHQQVKAYIDMAVEHARRVFRDAGGPALYVRPLVNYSTAPRTRAEAIETGIRLAKMVMEKGWPKFPESGMHMLHGEFPPIHGFTVLESVDGVEELWSAGSGGFVSTVDPVQVQDRLDYKARKLEAYAKAADEVWLLIVNDVFRNGAPCELGEQGMSHKYDFPFSRAFWFESGVSRLVELQRI